MIAPDLKNKRVAVVGNAQSIMNYNFGEEIDSHDFVIRINRAMNHFDVNEKYDAHVGKRTDMWCVWNIDEYESCNLDAEYIIQMASWHGCRTRTDILFYSIPEIFDLIKRSGIDNPSTGMMLLDWLSLGGVTSVDVYGFDWKETPTWTDVNREIDVRINHDFEAEKKYCRDIFINKHGYVFKGNI